MGQIVKFTIKNERELYMHVALANGEYQQRHYNYILHEQRHFIDEQEQNYGNFHMDQ